MRRLKELKKGIFKENPVFALVLGLCPFLAVSTSLINGIGMGIAAIFVFVCSNIIISLIRRFIPIEIRIPCFIVIIASFVTITELMMKAYSLALNRALGIYVPLIVVNCIVLGRAEAFASKNKVLDSFFDGLGMGIGFSLSLLLISGIREIFGFGTIFSYPLIRDFKPILMIGLPSGALLVIGLLLGFLNMIKR